MSNNVTAYSAFAATSINNAVITTQFAKAGVDAQTGADGSDNVSLGSKQQPHALVLSSAINAINDALAAKLGPNAIQNGASADHSAETTANSILAGSTGFFAAFKAQHPGEADDDVVKDFISTIRGGFEKGFGEAAGILGGLGVLDSGLSAAINKTRDLVEKGYDDFEKAHLSGASGDGDGAAAATGSSTDSSASSTAGTSARITVTARQN
ncbi:DUF5610 domain-containing protein [Rugamonas sp.]|uniref:DUF5610 domain-containing protein n=1 Tax=Rugamonas sp. TaxID=1926287 RepID=UPI0025F25BC6|nr:DUF5610 domain-containing protein [Rugamonas sp.]